MRALFLITIFFSITAHCEAREAWVCTDAATTRTGDLWRACGVGEGMNEGSARGQALDHAVEEFKSLCGLSTGCIERDRTVEPKRTTCSQVYGWWKCYRMIEVQLH